MTVSVRSYLAAGLAAATMSAMVVVPATPLTTASVTLPSIELSAIELSATVLPLLQPVTAAAGAMLGAAVFDSSVPAAAVAADRVPVAAATGSTGDMIINAYNALQPWVQWGFELGAWAVSYLPWPLGWLGQQVNIAYDTGQPIVQALVYSFAFLIDGQFDLIGPTLTNGVTTAVNNLVQGEIAWVLGFFPPLPPIPVFPVFPTAAVAGRAAAVAAPSAARTRSAAVASGTAAMTDPDASAETVPDAPVAGATSVEQPTTEQPTTEQQPDASSPGALESAHPRRGATRGSIRIRQSKPDVTTPHTETAPAAAETADAPASTSGKERGTTSRSAARAARSGQDG